MRLFAETFIVSKRMPKDCLMIVQEGAIEFDLAHAHLTPDCETYIVPVKYDLSKVSMIRCIGWSKKRKREEGQDVRRSKTGSRPSES